MPVRRAHSRSICGHAYTLAWLHTCEVHSDRQVRRARGHTGKHSAGTNECPPPLLPMCEAQLSDSKPVLVVLHAVSFTYLRGPGLKHGHLLPLCPCICSLATSVCPAMICQLQLSNCDRQCALPRRPIDSKLECSHGELFTCTSRGASIWQRALSAWPISQIHLSAQYRARRLSNSATSSNVNDPLGNQRIASAVSSLGHQQCARWSIRARMDHEPDSGTSCDKVHCVVYK